MRRAIAVCGLLAAGACGTAPRTVDSSVLAPQPLPRLRVTMLPPILDAESFGESVLGWQYPKDPVVSEPPTDAKVGKWRSLFGAGLDTDRDRRPGPHATDAAAVAAAIAWLVAHFGPLPPDTTLVATRVNPTASGPAGREVVLTQCWRGTPTPVKSIVTIRGSSEFSGHFQLASIEPVPGSVAPVIPAAAAIDAIANDARENGAKEADLAAFRNKARPRLEYAFGPDDVYSTEDYPTEGVRVLVWIYSPHWHLGLMVNAHTGIVWRND